MGGGAAPTKETKTVIVLGASYGGARAAQLLAAELPKEWRSILIDRNSHMNHVYVMPRFAVLPGHEYKAFIPLTNVFRDQPPNPKHITLQAHVTSIRPSCISITHHDLTKETIPFDYLIYALGSHLPTPLDLWGSSSSSISSIDEARKIRVLHPMTPTGVKYNGLKVEGIEWMKEKQRIVEEVPSVLIVGGGALGIQFATDIKSVYPSKQVTLLHSRKQVLPRFDMEMHLEVMKSMNELNVDVILGERLDLDSIPSSKVDSTTKPTIVRTVTGREISADLLLLCTGQVPNTSMLQTMDPRIINPDNKFARVLKTMQLSRPSTTSTSKPQNDKSDLEVVLGNLKIGISTNDNTPAKDVVVPEETVDLEKHSPYPHIFVTGDAADAFGAIPAGHNAYAQTEVAARNIIRLIGNSSTSKENEAEALELERYTPKPPAIKVSLGLNKFVYQIGDKVGTMVGDNEDLNVASMWPLFGITVEKDEDMRA